MKMSVHNFFSFLQNVITNPLKFSAIVVFLSSHTLYYFIFVLFLIVGFFCKEERSLVSFSGSCVVFFVFFSSFLLFVLLLFPITKRKIKGWVGYLFLDLFLL